MEEETKRGGEKESKYEKMDHYTKTSIIYCRHSYAVTNTKTMHHHYSKRMHHHATLGAAGRLRLEFRVYGLGFTQGLGFRV